MGRYKLALLQQSEVVGRAEEKIIDLIDDAYINGEIITQPDIEKILSIPPFNMSHGFICKKLKQLQHDKKIRCWQQNGINHFELTPKISHPFKIAIIVSTIVIGVCTLVDVANIYSSSASVYLLGPGGTNNLMQHYPFLSIAGIIVVFNFFWATLWTLNIKKDINNQL